MTGHPGPEMIVEGLKEAGVDMVATLPDINLHALLERVAMIMQNGGLFNSVNGIVSTLLQYNLPLLLLVYFAGDVGDRSFSTNGAMTQPVLDALGIRHFVLRDPQEARTLIKRTQVLTQDYKRPVAVLLTKDVLGRRRPGE